MKTIQIKLDSGKEVAVKKLPLGKYAELLGALDELPKHLNGFDTKSTDDLVAQLPKLIAVALPDVIKVVSIATDLTAEQVAELGLDEVVKIIVALIEVNNYAEVIETIKKLTARPDKK
jgi:hypothetical protein